MGSNGTTAEQIALLPSTAFNNSMERYEGPNEPDLSGDPDWVNTTRVVVKLLWANRNTSYPVVGPPLTSMEAYQALWRSQQLHGFWQHTQLLFRLCAGHSRLGNELYWFRGLQIY